MTALSISPDPRPLGKSGLEVFPVAWGMWRFAGVEVKTARARIDAALEAGITLFDTADVYGLDNACPFGAAEALLGEVLKEAPALRDRFVLATKCGIEPGTPYDSSEAYLRKALDASLARMKVEHVDLFQIHRPDMLAHPHDVAAALTKLRAEGKFAHIGVSNHAPSQVAALQAHLDFPIATQQPEFSCWATSPLFDGTLDQCMETGLGVLAWSPLAGGRLGLSAEEAARGADGARLSALIAKLDEIAVREGVTREAVAVAFVLAHPATIVPIIGSQQPTRIARAADALKVRLSRADWYGILQTSMGARLP